MREVRERSFEEDSVQSSRRQGSALSLTPPLSSLLKRLSTLMIYLLFICVQVQPTLSQSICGNGVVTGTEKCDDGNIVKGDGCSNLCRIETGFTCDNSGSPSVCTEKCGDGLDFGKYQCDDGNTNNGDGCSSSCAIETGYTCKGGTPSRRDVCKEICGDGLDFKTYLCDDGNLINGDGCSQICTLERGFQCSGGTSTSPDTCGQICGDGIIVTPRPETTPAYCDDRNKNNGDGCDSNCQTEVGYTCTGGSLFTRDLCKEICGDGIDLAKFPCEDGNTVSGDGCSPSCQVEFGYTCSGGTASNPDTCVDKCGDGFVLKRNSDKYCDDGNKISKDGCDSKCIIEEGFSCTGGSTTQKDTCTEICGDSMKKGKLQCDDGNQASSDGCSDICMIESGWTCTGGTANSADTCADICGDGLVFKRSPAEYCDDGNIPNGGCSDICLTVDGYSCTGGTVSSPDVCLEICGDSKRVGSEQCDDGGATASSGGCSNQCKIDAGFKCSGGSPTSPDTCTEICGDGQNHSGNECDDGNTQSGDGCSDTCKVEQYWSCSGGSPTSPDTCRDICGDGKIMQRYLSSTYCDDGNKVSDDGCSDSCSTENYWTCSGGTNSSPDTCLDICGDSIVVKRNFPGYCDKVSGNTGCADDCKTMDGWDCSGGDKTQGDTCTEICGDGKNYNGNPCDDGNTSPNDGCSATCQVETFWTCSGGSSSSKDTCYDLCGDDFVVKRNFDGYCDDGNAAVNDGCSLDCHTEDGWKCSGGTVSQGDTCTEDCGDGKNLGGNQCDDGNTSSDDGCSNTCSVETYWKCSGGSSSQPDTCSDVCGDDRVAKRNFDGYCDDGGDASNNGCDSSCMTNPGWKCTGGDLTKGDKCTEDCGDGKNYGGNACDDGNTNSNDGCSSTCEVEALWQCSGGSPTSKDVCKDICGDNKVIARNFNGYCDDGLAQGNDGCDANCMTMTGWQCSGGDATKGDTCTEICGDGKNYGGNPCDDRNTNSGDGCSSTCQVETYWQCSGGSTTTKDTCTDICGDNIVVKRNFVGYCDDGNDPANDGCDSNCKTNAGWKCTGGSATQGDTCKEICGDGKNYGGNACDDGNLVAGDGCSKLCAVEALWSCSGGSPTSPDTCGDICNDGKVVKRNVPGYCDNGDTGSPDGCGNDCMTETGYICSGGTSTKGDTCIDICGDGLKVSTVASTYCDDGNKVSLDGCSSTCQIEWGWSCSGGSVTQKDDCTDICGDGRVMKRATPGYCDDGGVLAGDGCSDTCQTETGFKCSGGTTKNRDTCSEICGDGLNFGNYQCDDGNTVNGDGCSSTCKIESGYECSGGSSTSVDVCQPIVPTGTLAECQAFASQFDNTCTSATAVSFSSLVASPRTCNTVGQCPSGQGTSATCNFLRILCVTCSVSGGSTRIRVQTNSMPSHCYYSTIRPVANKIDFTTYFNPRFRNPTAKTFATQQSLNDQVCTWNWPLRNLPVGFTSNLADAATILDGVVGVAFTGVPIYTGNTEANKDPFYPSPSGGNVQSSIDACLGIVTLPNNFYHYYSFSPCIQEASIKNSFAVGSCASTGNCSSSTLSYMSSAITTGRSLNQVGIALDGHIIYGPYKSQDTTWDSCDLDSCNGANQGSDYTYIMSLFHPYTVGCWGPGDTPAFSQTCSTQPRACT